MQIINGIPVWGDPDPGSLIQIDRCAKTADYAALMADHHKGYAIPIGGVLAYRDSISPSGVGFDIGCGIKGVRVNVPASEVRAHIKTIMDDIYRNLSFGVGRNNATRVDHPLFDSAAWKINPARGLKQSAENQLGTIGSGNHFVDLLVDENDAVWISAHFGSRGLGHKIASYFLKEGGATDGMDVDPLVLKVDTPLGSDYLVCMELAGAYAYAGRDWVCAEVADILGGDIVEEVHNHHNYAWYENHGGESVWVVRKGATPAFPGQRGFVGGSMGDPSYVLEGMDSPDSATALYSTIHGAGRAMSRTAARGKINRKTGEIISPGAVSNKMMSDWLSEKGVELRGAGLDEAPQAYKRIDEVLEHHLGTVKVVHKLMPIGVAMAGNDVVDPFKD